MLAYKENGAILLLCRNKPDNQKKVITMNTRRKAAQRKATIKSAALHIAAVSAFFVWALSAQLMIQGSI
jgi:hypothetical protein